MAHRSWLPEMRGKVDLKMCKYANELINLKPTYVKPSEVFDNPPLPNFEGNIVSLYGTPYDESPNEENGKKRDDWVEPNLSNQGCFELAPYAQVLKTIDLFKLKQELNIVVLVPF